MRLCVAANGGGNIFKNCNYINFKTERIFKMSFYCVNFFSKVSSFIKSARVSSSHRHFYLSVLLAESIAYKK